MITITHLFYTRFTHSSLNNIFYTTINNNIILFKNFFPLRFFLLFNYISLGLWGFPSGSVVKNPSAMQKPQETWVRSPGWKIPWRRVWHPTPVFLPGESHEQRNLVGYSPQGHKESATTTATQHSCTHLGLYGQIVVFQSLEYTGLYV